MIPYGRDMINDYLRQQLSSQYTMSGSTAPRRRTPEESLARLKQWFGDGTRFNWTSGPTTTTRGVFPTWLHVSSWYNNVVDHGYDLEDIGFGLEELQPLWAEYARTTFPVVYANYNKINPVDYPME